MNFGNALIIRQSDSNGATCFQINSLTLNSLENKELPVEVALIQEKLLVKLDHGWFARVLLAIKSKMNVIFKKVRGIFYGRL